MDKVESKKVWENLTDEQKKRLGEEYNDLLNWDKKERKKIEKKLKEEGKWKEGLDANQEDFVEVIEEKRRRFCELQMKYGFRKD